jgi:hypothetical protein
LDSFQISFYQKVFTIVADDVASAAIRADGGANVEAPRTWLAPWDVLYSASNSVVGNRKKNSLEQMNIKTGEFMNRKFSKTYTMDGIDNVGSCHWVYSSSRFRKGSPTCAATSTTAADSMRSAVSSDGLHTEQRIHLIRRSKYSLVHSEPDDSLVVDCVIPTVASQQVDGVTCGPRSLIMMCLSALGIMDPHTRDLDSDNGFWKFAILDDMDALYEWLADVLMAVDVDENGHPTRKDGLPPGAGWLPLPPFSRVGGGANSGSSRSRQALRAPFKVSTLGAVQVGFPLRAPVSASPMGHVHIGESTSTKRVTRQDFDTMMVHFRSTFSIEEEVVPNGLCPFGCGRRPSACKGPFDGAEDCYKIRTIAWRKVMKKGAAAAKKAALTTARATAKAIAMAKKVASAAARASSTAAKKSGKTRKAKRSPSLILSPKPTPTTSKSKPKIGRKRKLSDKPSADDGKGGKAARLVKVGVVAAVGSDSETVSSSDDDNGVEFVNSTKAPKAAAATTKKPASTKKKVGSGRGSCTRASKHIKSKKRGLSGLSGPTPLHVLGAKVVVAMDEYDKKLRASIAKDFTGVIDSFNTTNFEEPRVLVKWDNRDKPSWVDAEDSTVRAFAETSKRKKKK